ncbi:MAG: hypothetical protein U5N86_08875 [Planctomycetota bacterium]|nr:hypothetical protein [Planctomycetota bacterium]
MSTSSTPSRRRKLSRRIAFLIVVLIVLPLVIIAGSLLAWDWYRSTVEERQRKKVQAVVREFVEDVKSGTKVSQYFDMPQSVRYVFELEREMMLSTLSSNGVGDKFAVEVLESARRTLTEKFSDGGESFDFALDEARAFWAASGAHVRVESVESSDVDGVLKAGLVDVNRTRSELDLYLTDELKILYPVRLSAVWYELYDALVAVSNDGTGRAAYAVLVNGVLLACEFGYPGTSRLKQLADLPSQWPSEVDAQQLIDGLLDTVHTADSLAALSELVQLFAEKNLLQRSFADSALAEANAIELYVNGNYDEALRAFLANRTADFAGTEYYISLCAAELGKEESPGANMRHILPNRLFK